MGLTVDALLYIIPGAALAWLGYSIGNTRGYAKGAVDMRTKIDKELEGYLLIKRRGK